MSNPPTEGVLLLCDHALNQLPPRLENLGITAASLQSHIAWDPGALGVAAQLAELLNAPLIKQETSRLVIDCNRSPEDPDSIATVADSIVIPGNLDVSAEERTRRIREIYQPYHAAISAAVAKLTQSRQLQAIVSMHSFEPAMGGVERPWHVGIISSANRRLADPLIAALRAIEGLIVGDNEPYSPDDRVYHTLQRHAESRQLPSAMIEIRNDLITTPQQQKDWADILSRSISEAVRALTKHSDAESADSVLERSPPGATDHDESGKA